MRLFEGTEFDIPPRCDRCEKLEEECECLPEPEPIVPPHEQKVSVCIEKRKRGKVVTVLRGFLDQETQLQEVFTKLKNSCGAGGTVREAEIDIQGKHEETVRRVLKEIGFRL